MLGRPNRLIPSLVVACALAACGDSTEKPPANPFNPIADAGANPSLNPIATNDAATLPGAMPMIPTPAGGDAGTGAAPSVGDAGVAPAVDAAAPAPLGAPITPECEGFPLKNRMDSPGGNVLPNKCHPFHPTLNNPYAVRCIDAWPWYKTKYPGDEYCILPPPADKGIQVGFHPQQDKYWEQVSKQDLSGYNAPSSDWELKAGGEETKTYHAIATNPTERKYYRTYFRMRTGSHHNIITMHDGKDPAAWDKTDGEALPALFDPTAGNLTGVLGGQERPDDNTPVTFEKPPEDDGLYLTFPVNPNIHYNVHHFNTTKAPILKEGWVNIWWEDSGTKLISWFMGLDIGQALLLDIPPGQTRDLHYSFAPETSVRVVRFFGHRHVWTPNFSGWVERKGGKVEMIYQSFDWLDMPSYRYDSVAKNPAPNFDQRIDGATTGILTLEKGDKLHFNCHIEYTDARAAEENAPKPATNGNLQFANQALTAEMCIAFGNVTGGSLGSPAETTTPLPPEARK